MGQSSSGVLDIYRFALTASRIEPEDRENMEIAEQVFLAANNFPPIEVRSHFAQFKSFVAAIDGTSSRESATHIIRFTRPLIVRKFKDAVERDPAFPLFDFSNSEVEGRFHIGEVDGYLAQALIASAIDHSAEAIWQFLLELLPRQVGADELSILIDCRKWDEFGNPFPLLAVGDLINIDVEV
jgi:hypothetical protein